MFKILRWLKSRTLWAGIAMFVLGGIQAVEAALPVEGFIFLEAILLFLVGYFRANPKVV